MKGLRQPETRSAEFYLAYIRELRANDAQQRNIGGITHWALLGALVLVVQQFFSLLSSTWDVKSQVAQAADIYVCGLVALTFCELLFSSGIRDLVAPNRTIRKQRFDYVVLPETGFDLFRGLARIAVYLAAPSIVAWFYGSTAPQVLPVEFVLWVAKWLYGTVFLGAIILLIVFYKQYRPLPSVGNYIAAKALHPISRIATFCFTVTIPLVIFSMSMWALAAYMASQDYFFGRTNWLIAGYFVVASYLAGRLLDATRKHDTVENLDRLERDIVLYRVTEEGIRTRLGAEILGVLLGDDISLRIQSMKNDAKELLGEYKGLTKEVKDDLAAIDQWPRNKKRKKIQKYLHAYKKLDAKLKKVIKRERELLKWYSRWSALSNKRDDPYMREVMDSMLDDLKRWLSDLVEDSDQIFKASHDSRSALREHLDQVAYLNRLRKIPSLLGISR